MEQPASHSQLFQFRASSRLPALRFPIVWRIFASAILTLAVGFGGLLIVVERIVDNVVHEEIENRVAIANRTLWRLVRDKGTPAIVGGALRLGAWTANGDNTLVDDVKELTGGESTLFQMIDGKPIRVTTTIVKLDGSGRNIGTELLGPARRAIDARHSFAGVSPVAGRDFINRYDLLRDARGAIIGVVYSGIPLTARDAAVKAIMRAVIASTICALVISVVLMYFVTAPLRRLFVRTIRVADGLAHGDVDQRSGPVSNDEVGDINAAFKEMIAYQQRMAEVADAIADGDLSVNIIPVSANDRLGVAFTRMLGNVRNSVAQLETLASTDGLTKIGNLRSFQDEIRTQLSAAAREGRSVSLVLVDIDEFKAVNDTYGHQHGDVILARLGKLLKTLRAHDRAYRLGGDEFAVIMPGVSGAEARVAMERLHEEAPRQLFGATLSFGVATSYDGAIAPDELQRQADIALYIGKQNGRNNVVLFEDTQRLDGTNENRSALCQSPIVVEDIRAGKCRLNLD